MSSSQITLLFLAASLTGLARPSYAQGQLTDDPAIELKLLDRDGSVVPVDWKTTLSWVWSIEAGDSGMGSGLEEPVARVSVQAPPELKAQGAQVWNLQSTFQLNPLTVEMAGKEVGKNLSVKLIPKSTRLFVHSRCKRFGVNLVSSGEALPVLFVGLNCSRDGPEIEVVITYSADADWAEGTGVDARNLSEGWARIQIRPSRYVGPSDQAVRVATFSLKENDGTRLQSFEVSYAPPARTLSKATPVSTEQSKNVVAAEPRGRFRRAHTWFGPTLGLVNFSSVPNLVGLAGGAEWRHQVSPFAIEANAFTSFSPTASRHALRVRGKSHYNFGQFNGYLSMGLGLGGALDNEQPSRYGWGAGFEVRLGALFDLGQQDLELSGGITPIGTSLSRSTRGGPYRAWGARARLGKMGQAFGKSVAMSLSYDAQRFPEMGHHSSVQTVLLGWELGW